MERQGFSLGRVLAAGTAAVFCIGFLATMTKLAVDVPVDEYVVVQSPVAGDLTWYTSPGWKNQGFGEVTRYKQLAIYDFNKDGYRIQFNDGGHGEAHGSIQFTLPSDDVSLTKLHRRYKTMDNLQSSLLKRATDSSLYLVGTLMSSKESYAEKKNDLIYYVTDQVQNGIYKTRQVRKYVKDPATEQQKEVIVGEIMHDEKTGEPLRQEPSPLLEYNIKVSLFTIEKMPYDKVIEEQIAKQQQIAMDVQTSAANLKLKEQEAQTAEQEGRANATREKWKQEAIKAVEVTKAEQDRQVATIAADREKQVAEVAANRNLTVAKLDRETAEQTKQKLILEGQGESEKRKLILAADGALAQKLATYEKVTSNMFASLANARLVPTVAMGGNASAGVNAGAARDGLALGTGSPATDLLNLFQVKVARDLALDMDMSMKNTGGAQR